MFDWFKKKAERSEHHRPEQEPAFQRATIPPRRSELPTKSPAELMREMRYGWLTKAPEKGSYSREDEVVAAVMDWPLGEQIVSVLSSSNGDASLYTTSTFGIIGGIGHESVRKAATAFIDCAQHFLSITSPTTVYPYPDKQSLCFYMVTPSGIRTVSFPLEATEQADSPARALFAYGQQVVTELRLTMPIQK
jgi:hypothetical protein